MPEVKQLGSGRAENWARFWGFTQESVPSVGLQSSRGQEGVKREAMEPGNAMKEGIVQGTLESWRGQEILSGKLIYSKQEKAQG